MSDEEKETQQFKIFKGDFSESKRNSVKERNAVITKEEEAFLAKHPKGLNNPFADCPTLIESNATEAGLTEENGIPAFEPPVPIHRETALEKVIESDVAIMNNSLLALHAAWSQVRSISSLCRLVQTTTDTVRARRQLLLHPDAANNQDARKNLSLPTD